MGNLGSRWRGLGFRIVGLEAGHELAEQGRDKGFQVGLVQGAECGLD